MTDTIGLVNTERDHQRSNLHGLNSTMYLNRSSPFFILVQSSILSLFVLHPYIRSCHLISIRTAEQSPTRLIFNLPNGPTRKLNIEPHRLEIKCHPILATPEDSGFNDARFDTCSIITIKPSSNHAIQHTQPVCPYSRLTASVWSILRLKDPTLDQTNAILSKSSS